MHAEWHNWRPIGRAADGAPVGIAAPVCQLCHCGRWHTWHSRVPSAGPGAEGFPYPGRVYFTNTGWRFTLYQNVSIRPMAL